MPELSNQTIQRFWIIDAHCDSIAEHIKGKRNLAKAEKSGQLDLPGLRASGVLVQFFASYIESEYKPGAAVLRGLELVQGCLKLINSSPEYLVLLLEAKDIELARDIGRTAALLSIEGGEVLGGKLFMLSLLHDMGVRSIGLTWNQANELGGGVDQPGVLTSFGKEVVREMNRLGMLVDVSHCSERTFWDVMEIADKPVIASHSCCRELHNHPRNLSNNQIQALARGGGVIGINFYSKFLSSSKADIMDIVEHIKHVCNIVGPDYVGLGSDFDGCDELPVGLGDVYALPRLIELLHQNGFTQEEVQKIAGGNFERVIREVLR